VKRVLDTGPSDGAAAHLAALSAAGFHAEAFPCLELFPCEPAWTPHPDGYDLAIVTSRAAVPWLLRHRGTIARLACVGQGTAACASDGGWTPSIVATAAAERLMALVATGERPRSVLWPRGSEALPTVRERIEAWGARVDAPIVYRSEKRTYPRGETARAVFSADAVVADESPGRRSTRGGTSADEDSSARVPRVVALGETTAARCRALGFPGVTVVESPSSEASARAVALAFSQETSP
jgi:uroporphyrinogen-III synthase